jgi:hypothetical protein
MPDEKKDGAFRYLWVFAFGLVGIAVFAYLNSERGECLSTTPGELRLTRCNSDLKNLLISIFCGFALGTPLAFWLDDKYGK